MIIKKTGIFILLIMFFLSGCISNLEKTNSNGISYIKDGEFYKPCLSIGDTKLDNYEIAERLFIGYLEYQKGKNTGLKQRIKEYKINKIAVGQSTDTNFTFNVTFSILPFDNNSFVLAGNGVANQSTGWIEDKFYVISVIKKDGIFIMNSWGTGG